MKSVSITFILLFLFPLLVGGLIYWRKPEFVLANDIRFSAWVSDQKENLGGKDGVINTYLNVPTLSALAKLLEWTSQIKDEYTRCGVRAAVYQYFLVALVVLAYVAFQIAMFVLGLLMLWGILWVLNEIFGGEKMNDERTVTERPTYGTDAELKPKKPSMLHLAAGKGGVYSGSSWLNEEKIGSVDADGKIMKDSNWLTKEQVGRLDAEGKIIQGTNWMNEEQVGSVDAEGRIYQGTSWTNKEQIGRIDEDGNVFEGVGWLNENKVGRVDPKKE